MEAATLSPNQIEKRRQIVEAATGVLLTHGLDRFTTRTLTEHSPFSRSAIHYYFDSVEEIVTAAMTSQLEHFVATLDRAAAALDDPVARFWAVTEGYLQYFTDRPQLALLWFDYSIREVQAGRPQPVIDTEVQLRQILVGLLRDCDAADWESRSEALLAFMLGATLRGVFHPGSAVGDLRRQLAVLSGLPANAA